MTFVDSPITGDIVSMTGARGSITGDTVLAISIGGLVTGDTTPMGVSCSPIIGAIVSIASPSGRSTVLVVYLKIFICQTKHLKILLKI